MDEIKVKACLSCYMILDLGTLVCPNCGNTDAEAGFDADDDGVEY